MKFMCAPKAAARRRPPPRGGARRLGAARRFLARNGRARLTVLALLLGAVARAQAPAGDAMERDRIRAERAAAEALYAQQVQLCSQKFVVTSCVDAARAQRHAELTRLDREQQLLDEAQRAQRAGERLQAIESKRSGEEARLREEAARERSAKRRDTRDPKPAAAPSVVFLDEIDSIAPARGGSTSDSHVTERVISQILTELDGLEALHNVVVVAATNRPDIIDAALLRPGRFDRLIEIELPDEKARLEILKIHAAKKPLAEDVNLEELAKKTEKYSGADLSAIVNEAVMLAIRECVLQGKSQEEEQICNYKIEKRHFDEAMKKVQPTAAEMDLYKRFTKER